MRASQITSLLAIGALAHLLLASEPDAASWGPSDYQSAASAFAASSGGLHHAVAYLRSAAGLEGGSDPNRWLSFGRALAALAAADPPYELDRATVQAWVSEALSSATRVLGTRCHPGESASGFRECQGRQVLARDVLAELIVHCDGALSGLCPEQYLAPLRSSELPAWPSAVHEARAAEEEDSEQLPCDIARRSWPDLTADAFEKGFNQPGIPVIVSGLTAAWPAAAWAEEEGSTDVSHRAGQSLARSLMRRAYALPPYARANPASFFGVRPFAHGETLDNQYVNLDDVSTAYRHPLLAGYSPVPLVQPSLLRTQQCFPRRADVTDAAAQQASFHVHSRWALVSAGGSGSAWHIDPWNTSAWNALLSGRKRWALYPPGVAGLPAGVAASSPRAFFGRVLGSLPPEERPQQCVLREGETMFVPSGWWHAVLNLSPTIAITENRVDGANLAAVLEEMRAADPASESGRRAATACRRLMEGQADRGEYPRDCAQRLDPNAVSDADMADCVRRLETCSGA